jgi:hypothetical protein
LDSQIENESFDVSDEEVQQFFAFIEQQNPDQSFVYEDEEEQIKEILIQQKKQDALNGVLEQIVSEADVQYN